MLNMQQHPSAIARLRSQLAAGHIANVSDFWRDAESLNGPLVMPVEGAEDEREVTFLWRAWHSLQGVYLRLNNAAFTRKLLRLLFADRNPPRHSGQEDCTGRRPLCRSPRARRSAKQNAKN